MYIREMRLDDAAPVARLAGQLGYAVSPDDCAERMAQLIHRQRDAMWIAEGPAAGILGWAHAAEHLSLLGPPRAELVALIVDEDHRSRGTGATLMRTAEEWAAARGYPCLRLGSNIVRPRAHAFYVRQGYTVEKTWLVFSKALTSGM
jgi:GNAT superfamily N-acetyltransferase